jgi:hypothetical protein
MGASLQLLAQLVVTNRMTGRVLAVVAVIAGFAGTAAPAGAAGGAPPPRAALGQFVCETATDPLSRVVSVTSTMRPMSGTQSMRLRFVLLERIPGHVFRPVKGGDLGRWHQAPSETWVVTKPVANLSAPAVYRFRVSFVWVGRSGGILGAETLVGPTCRQPG